MDTTKAQLKITKSASWLLLFYWFALLFSQSFMNLADLLLVVAAILSFSLSTAHERKLPFPFWSLFFVWGILLISGALINHLGFDKILAIAIEFRWFITFPIIVLLIAKSDLNWSQFIAMSCIFLFWSAISLEAFFILDEESRLEGTYRHSMPFAHNWGPASALILITSLYGFYKTKEKKLLVTGAIGLFGILLTGLTLTRGVIYSLGLSLVLCAAMINRRWLISMLIGCLVIGASLMMSPAFKDRFIGNFSSNQSNLERLNLWKANWQIFLDHPALGVGYGEAQNYLPEYYAKFASPPSASPIAHAHNQYLHLASGTGALGLTCYLVFFAACLFLSFRLFKNSQNIFVQSFALGSLSAQVTYCLSAFTEASFAIEKNRYFILFVISLTLGLFVKMQRESNN